MAIIANGIFPESHAALVPLRHLRKALRAPENRAFSGNSIIFVDVCWRATKSRRSRMEALLQTRVKSLREPRVMKKFAVIAAAAGMFALAACGEKPAEEAAPAAEAVAEEAAPAADAMAPAADAAAPAADAAAAPAADAMAPAADAAAAAPAEEAKK